MNSLACDCLKGIVPSWLTVKPYPICIHAYASLCRPQWASGASSPSFVQIDGRLKRVPSDRFMKLTFPDATQGQAGRGCFANYLMAKASEEGLYN